MSPPEKKQPSERLQGATLGRADRARHPRADDLWTTSELPGGRAQSGRTLPWPDLALVVEIDGIHHARAENVVGDALRQNSLAIDGDTVLRVPLLGLRLEPAAFYDQIAEAISAKQAAAVA